MTSAQNRLLPLNGNRWLLFLLITLIAGGCAPKLRPVPPPVKKPNTVTKTVKPTLPPAPKISVVSLLLPFGLDHIGPGLSYDPVSLKKAQVAADYYRGFKLALDSLTFYGYNYKLQVYDTRDEAAISHSLALNPQIRNSDLTVGPVFPEDIKSFSDVFRSTRKMLVSPLSPAAPATIKNPELVTANPPLEYHARCAAKYIADKIKPQKIFVLHSGYSEDNDYLTPFNQAIDSLGKKHIKVIELTVIHGQLTPLSMQFMAGKPNVFVIASTNQEFLTVTLRSLEALSKKINVVVFGHPSWAKFSFLNVRTLQHINAHITSADNIDYRSSQYVTFARNYRKEWRTEPTGYAVKGFDEGLYFGRLLAEGKLKDIGTSEFMGLHNDFMFVKKPGTGWINTHTDVLLYNNFALKKIE